MKRLVRLRDEADRDLTDAASWYEQQHEGLGHEFLDDAQSLFDRIGEEPLRNSSSASLERPHMNNRVRALNTDARQDGAPVS